MTVSEQTLSTVKKLFALSANNPNKAEAEVAMLKAQALLAKHHLTIKDLDTAEKKDDIVTISACDFDTISWKGRLADIIARNFRCKSFFWATKFTNDKIDKRAKVVTVFLGHEEDAQIAKETYLFAKHQIIKGANKWYARIYQQDINRYGYARNTKGVKGDYANGFLQGLNEKFRKQVDENGWGLIVVTPQDVLDVYNKKDLKDGKRNRTRVSNNSKVMMAGYRDGLSFSHNKQIEEVNQY